MAQRAKDLYDLGVFYVGTYDPDFEEYYRSSYGGDVCAAVKESGWEPHAAEALKLYKLLASEHRELSYRRGKLGDAADRTVFELENPTIGKIAPDIEGEDIDGVAFKLSDYRGKVVVLDFWGDW